MESNLQIASRPGCLFKAFTRVLHRGSDDELMYEIPTWRVDPHRKECDKYCDFPVADRSPALAKWIMSEDSKQCSHIMLVETDYVFVAEPSDQLLVPPGYGWGFPFGYIVP